MPEPDELVLAIARRLEIDWQYVEHVETWDAERIAEVRSAGRKAGRMQGLKIATIQSEPRDDGRVVVVVALREAPDDADAERMRERAQLLIQDAYDRDTSYDTTDE